MAKKVIAYSKLMEEKQEKQDMRVKAWLFISVPGGYKRQRVMIVGVTPTTYRVEAREGFKLPKNRGWVSAGDKISVPKRFVQAELPHVPAATIPSISTIAGARLAEDLIMMTESGICIVPQGHKLYY